MTNKAEYISKPTYALAGFHRQQNGGQGEALFGSDLRHPTTIALTIYEAEVKRDLSQEWYFGHKVIAEVVFSPLQFSELLTTMNVGSGIPCTLRYRESTGWIKHEAEPPKREAFDREIQDDCDTVADNLNELMEALNDTKMTVKDRARLKGLLSKAHQTVTLGMPFVAKQFERAMDRTQTEAKAAVEAFIMHNIVTAGLDAITERKNMPMLQGGEPSGEGEAK